MDEPEISLAIRDEQREKVWKAWNQTRGEARIIDFHVSSFDQHNATVEWSTNASMDVRLSLFRGASRTPEQTVTVQSLGLPGHRQTKTFQDLEPGTYYRIDVECGDDRKRELVKTLDAWTR